MLGFMLPCTCTHVLRAQCFTVSKGPSHPQPLLILSTTGIPPTSYMSKLTSREVKSYSTQSLADAKHGSLTSAQSLFWVLPPCPLGRSRVPPAHSSLSEEREIEMMASLGFWLTPPPPPPFSSTCRTSSLFPGDFTWEGMRVMSMEAEGAPETQPLCSRRYLDVDLRAAED